MGRIAGRAERRTGHESAETNREASLRTWRRRHTRDPGKYGVGETAAPQSFCDFVGALGRPPGRERGRGGNGADSPEGDPEIVHRVVAPEDGDGGGDADDVVTESGAACAEEFLLRD